MGELEQAVLDALWDGAGASSGREVHARLVGRDLAYTTVMTVLDRLVATDSPNFPQDLGLSLRCLVENNEGGCVEVIVQVEGIRVCEIWRVRGII